MEKDYLTLFPVKFYGSTLILSHLWSTSAEFYDFEKNPFCQICPLRAFFDRTNSYFFSLNSSCATNFGPILKIFVMCTPPDLGGSNEYFGSLLGSSVLEELLRKSTWYFFFGTKEVFLNVRQSLPTSACSTPAGPAHPPVCLGWPIFQKSWKFPLELSDAIP